jgi:hypothetical protein
LTTALRFALRAGKTTIAQIPAVLAQSEEKAKKKRMRA